MIAGREGPGHHPRGMMLDRTELEESPLSDLHAIASELGIEGYRRLRKAELIDSILADGSDAREEAERPTRGGRRPRVAEQDNGESKAPARRRRGGGRRRGGQAAVAEEEVEQPAESERSDDGDEAEEGRTGVLDVLPNGSGFMRADPFLHTSDDVYVSPAQIRRCDLRTGDRVEGPVRRPRRSERHPALVRVDRVNGAELEEPAERPRFDELTARFASRRITAPDELERVPFGRGSRVAIGGPPGAGITTLLRRIALAIAEREADVELIVVLAGVRPEEVPEWREEASLNVVGAPFDRPVDEQSQAAELAVELAKRAVEGGRDTAIVIDSLDALPPAVARRVFGAARATEQGGSLTVIGGTGVAGEPMRLATTRVLLEAPPNGPKVADGSGTLRAERLK